MNDELEVLAFESKHKAPKPGPNYEFAIWLLFVATVFSFIGTLAKR